MTDIVTYCDINTCEDCPRYGDDCDGGGDAEMDNCQAQAPQNYMQQSRHDDGKDLISRADAIEAVASITMSIHLSDVICDKLLALPSAETHEIRTETHGVCLISKDDAMGAVQDHFNANGFKGYDDGQKMMDRIKALPSADAEQVTGKLKKPCDSLLTEESNGSKEQKSKLEHDREWIIGCIKHDGFIKTDRFDKANQIILEALSAVQGEWVCKKREYNDCDGYYAHFWYECSVCGARPPKDAWKNEWHSDYCPSCGARMFKGGDDE